MAKPAPPPKTSPKNARAAASMDALTGLPLLSSVHNRVREELRRHGEIGFVYFDVVQYRQLQATYGPNAARALLKLLGDTFYQLRGRLFRDEDLVAVGGLKPDYFAVFLFSPPRRKQTFSTQDLKLIRHRLLARLTDLVNEQRGLLGIDEQIDLHSGYTVISANGRSSIPRLINEAQKEASMKAQLEEIMKNLISNVSHELRTPLTCIEGYAETLLEGAMGDPQLCKRWLQIIYEEAQRLERLIKDLLDLSMLEARHIQLRWSRVNMLKVIDDTAAILSQSAQKSEIRVSVDAPADLPFVTADEDRIRQVLFNLVENAIKYSRKSDRVRIKARHNEGEVTISVIDSGLGIPKNDLDRIFDRFYRVDKGRAANRGGRGLGLAIAKNFIEAHGGILTVKSQLEKGSQFTFSLPVGEPWVTAEDAEER
jgi:signal transduction histidine kinase